MRPVTVDDSADLVDLFAACFGTHPSAEYFKWKYYDNPAGDVIGFVAEGGGGLAGFYGVIPEPWMVGGAATTVHQSMDTMTHPDFRRRGLFVRLAELTYEEVRARTGRCDLIGIPGPTSLPGFTGRLGWTQIHEFDVITVATPLVRAWPIRGDREVGVERIEKPDERIQAVLDNAPEPRGDAWPRLSGEFFDWRVFGLSPKRFRVALASRGGRPIALCVYTHDSPRATMISYAIGLRGEEPGKWLPPLLRFVARQGVILYTWRPQRGGLADLYRSMGFRAYPLARRSLPRRVPLIVRSDADLVNGLPWADARSYDLQPLAQD